MCFWPIPGNNFNECILGVIEVELLKKLINSSSNFKTSVVDVYAAGDASYGASLIVHAIQQGRQAAKAIDEYLTLEEK